MFIDRSKILVCTSAIAALSSSLIAAPFDPERVAADAKFVVHIDADAARDSAIGKMLLQRIIDNPDYAEFEKIMMDVAGFMPASDINDVTIYGDRFEQNPDAVLVINAKFDAASLRGGVGLARGFKTDTYADHELLSWDDERTHKRINACLYDAKTILMCNDPKKLCGAIDVLKEPSKSIEGSTTFPKPSAESKWLFIGGTGVAAAPGMADNPVVSQIGAVSIEVGEAGDNSIARLIATTAAADKAEQLFNLANGVKALGAMAGNSKRAAAVDDRAKMLSELASATVVKRDAANVTATLTLGNDRAVEVVEDAMDRREDTRAGHRAATKP